MLREGSVGGAAPKYVAAAREQVGEAAALEAADAAPVRDLKGHKHMGVEGEEEEERSEHAVRTVDSLEGGNRGGQSEEKGREQLWRGMSSP